MKNTRIIMGLIVLCLVLSFLPGCSGSDDPAGEAMETEATLVMISVTPTTAEAQKGDQLQYTATATYSDGATSDITAKAEWKSSDEDVVTIGTGGLAAAQAEGDVTITATLEGVSGYALLTVVAGIIPSTGTFLSITPQKASIEVGESMWFQAMQTGADGSIVNLSSEVTWSSSATNIATIDADGKAQGISAGQTSITAASSGSLLGFAILTVSQTDLSSLESLSILPMDPDLQLGRSMQLCAVANFAGNVSKIVTTDANWSSSDEGIATLGSTGLAVAKGLGQTSISTSWEGKSATTTLTVVEGVTSITVIDGMGNEVEVPYPVRRIASFTPAATEAIWALGADDRIVGCDITAKLMSEFFHTVADRPSTGMVPVMPDYEKIISLRPDVVIAYIDPLFNYPYLEEKMASAGIEVLRLDLYKPETFAREVTVLGQILGKENKAQDYIAYAEAYASSIRDKVENIPEDEKVTVYYEWFMPYFAYGEGTGGYQLIEMAGGRDIYSREGGESMTMPGYTPGEGVYYSLLSPEWIVAQKPDVLIKDYAPVEDYMNYMTADIGDMPPLTVGYTSQPNTAEMEAARDEMMSRPGFHVIPAVENGDVYTTPFCGLCLSPRWSVGLGYMAKWFYPDLFEDLDPQAFHAEWLQEWYGLEYKGIYFYPDFE